MGIILNICKRPDSPEQKAKAEELAVVTQQSLTEIYLGTAQFDRAGQYYWERKLVAAKGAITSAFNHLAKAKNQLKDILKLEFEMYSSSPTNLDGVNDDLFYGMSNLDSMFRERVRGIQHTIQVIEHLEFVNAEKRSLDSLDNNDIRGVYKAVSNPARELLKAALNLHSSTLEHSKITHETSDLLYDVYDLKPIGNGL